jgi:hypothetical protein
MLDFPSFAAARTKPIPMNSQLHFTFEADWRDAPLAFWVHLPKDDLSGEYLPPAPKAVLHKGFPVLHLDVAGVDLRFSSMAQLEHFIEVMGATPRPTSRQLSQKRGTTVGPNGHWLSRLPAQIKAPKEREKLLHLLRSARDQIVPLGDSWHSYPHLL